MSAIYKKELKSYFNSVVGYLYIALILIFMGIFATFYNFKGGLTDISSALGNIGFIFLLITPLLTMRIIAEERQRKTDQLLYSLPVSVSGTVIAKYLAMLTVFGIAVLFLALYPIIFSFYGSVNFAFAYGCLFGFFLEGATLLAIGMFISSLTENQAISAGITFIVMLLIYFSSAISSLLPSTAMASFIAFSVVIWLIAVILYYLMHSFATSVIAGSIVQIAITLVYLKDQTLFQGLFGKFIDYLSVFDRFIAMLNGVFDLTAIVYYITLICLFVFLSIQSVEKRRWS